MEAYYVMTYGAKSGSLPLLPPLFENNEAGGDFLAKEALDAVKEGCRHSGHGRCTLRRHSAGRRTKGGQAEDGAHAESKSGPCSRKTKRRDGRCGRTTHSTAGNCRTGGGYPQKSAAKQRERNPRYPRGHHRLTRRQHERRGSPYGGNAYEAHQHLCAQEPS